MKKTIKKVLAVIFAIAVAAAALPDVQNRTAAVKKILKPQNSELQFKQVQTVHLLI